MGGPDAERRSLIENVYKKRNGTLDGLDDKIRSIAASSIAMPAPTPEATPAPTPTPQI